VTQNWAGKDVRPNRTKASDHNGSTLGSNDVIGRLFVLQSFWRLELPLAPPDHIRPITKAASVPSGAPEKVALTLGVMPLSDCAPFVSAEEAGLFAKHGLDVTLSPEPSWATMRDRVLVGALDGGQMLAPIPLAATLGLGGLAEPMVTAFSVGLNGNAVTLSTDLAQRMCAIDDTAFVNAKNAARILGHVIGQERAAKMRPRTFAVVFPFSSHNYLLRLWLSAGGIDPDRDVRLVTVPPPKMVDHLATGQVDGFCVGEPWNQCAVAFGLGRLAATGHAIWNNAPDKVFAVTERFADTYPNTHRALIMALMEAAQMADPMPARASVASALCRSLFIEAPPAIIGRTINGHYQPAPDEDPVPFADYHVFYRYAATFPWRSQAIWFLTQMYRWGQIDSIDNASSIAERVYRSDIHRDAAAALDFIVPDFDYKPEGIHAGTWVAPHNGHLTLGPDLLVDGRSFDPHAPADYLIPHPPNLLQPNGDPA
jgi:nitrate/nitrite transport system substrate-binding protein